MKTSPEAKTTNPSVVSRDRWLAARKTPAAHERELTHLRDQIARERRALPWVRVDKNYVFDTPEGRARSADLFEGRRQLLVQHFMFGPGWEQGCPSCSFMADHSDGMTVHLAQRDVSFVAISRATLAEIERFRQRMGWQFRWVSSNGNDFNFDFGVSFTPQKSRATSLQLRQATLRGDEMPGVSVFYKDEPATSSTPTRPTARRGSDDGHLPPARPHAQGPRRRRRPRAWHGCATTTATRRNRQSRRLECLRRGASPLRRRFVRWPVQRSTAARAVRC
jgi:predicted dithiol-disulfide oxidoreductase (DUF899 family)